MLKPLAIVLAAGVALLLAMYGTGEAGVREVVRWTARSSVLLFCAAFATEGRAVRLAGWPGRSQLLRGLALSHGVHAVAVAALAVQLKGRNLLERSSPVAVLGGTLAYGTRALRLPMPFAFAVALLVAAMLARLSALLARTPARAPQPS
ncbi:MAG TPA: hypothetical protein VII62_12900 [Vicinamibacteria bacterium]